MIKDEKPNSDKTRNAWYIAASQTFGKETIKIAYANASDGDNPATNTGATWMAVGIDHALSKRATIYALYAQTKNETNATYGLGTGRSRRFIHAGSRRRPVRGFLRHQLRILICKIHRCFPIAPEGT